MNAMINTKTIPDLFRNLPLFLIIFFFHEGIVYSANVPGGDSLNSLIEFTAKTFSDTISVQKSSANFYKTDSIFSFRSKKGYFPSLVHNIGEQATAPLRFTAKEWIITGAAVGITAALIYADEDIDEWARIQKQKHNWVNKSSPFISEFGSNYGVYSVIAAGLISAACKNGKGVQTSLLATQAMITSGIWTQIIKQLTGRERPKASYIFSHIEGGRWHGPLSRFLEKSADDRSGFSYDAFPSGHTATAFSIATVFATQYKNIKAVPVICYSLATAVGISRLTEHEHWASDVFVGALLGYVCGKQVVRHFNRIHQNSGTLMPSESRNKAEITFIQDGNQFGLSIVW